MKKLLSLIMAMVLASALFGCGSPDSSSSGGDSAGGSETASSAEGNTGETNKLTMILRAGSYTDVMKNMAPAFGEEHNVEFEYLDLDVANMYAVSYTHLALPSRWENPSVFSRTFF